MLYSIPSKFSRKNKLSGQDRKFEMNCSNPQYNDKTKIYITFFNSLFPNLTLTLFFSLIYLYLLMHLDLGKQKNHSNEMIKYHFIGIMSFN